MRFSYHDYGKKRKRERESWRESMTDNDPIAESVSGYHAGVEGNLR